MKLRTVLVCLLLCVLSLCFVSCQGNGDAFSQVEKDGCVCRVTYDLGNGTVNGINSLLYCVEENALLPALGTAPGTTAPIFPGYRLIGFYRNADFSGDAWNFDSDRVTENITLYAKWEKNFSIQIRYGEGNNSSYSVEVNPEKATFNTFRQMAWSGHTFYGFYYDDAYTEPVTFPYTHALNPEQTSETVYAKYLDGVYTIIRTAEDFKGTINSGTKYYLDADIDLSDTSITVADTFSGAFIGNGHTITGLSVTRNQTKNSEYYGMFGQIGASAVFENVTFANVTVNVVLGNEQNSMISHIGGLAGSVKTASTFTNVTVSGSLTYDCKGRNLLGEGKLVVEDVFGEDAPNDVSTLTVNMTVQPMAD